MSGCYRCGLSEGRDDRLCETCYRLRFHCGRDVIDLPPGVEPEGLEFSPRVRAIVLSSSAALYVSFLGLVLAFHHQTQTRTGGDPRLSYQAVGEHQAIVDRDARLGDLRVIAGSVADHHS
jgi:hypothetical protein